MPIYIILGPAAALIGIVAVFFVMRHKSVQTKSMYSSRRSQFERKVRAARSRTLAPHGRGGQAPTAEEIAAAAPSPSGTIYEAPPAPARSAWDVGPAPAPAPASTYSPPPAPTTPAAPSGPAEPSTPAPAEPAWTPTPIEPSWTPGPAAAPAPAPATPAREPVARAETSAGEGASWSIVSDARETSAEKEAPAKGKKKAQAPTGSEWSLASGEAPTESADDGEIKAPSTAMAVAQYAVLVVGLVMVLIGVLVMVANQKVT
jgi:uncharacterized integral membrane protein